MDRNVPRTIPFLGRLPACLAVLAGLGLAGCNGTTAAVDGDLGVVPSPTAIGSGKPIPAGGGERKLGKPYKVGGRWFHPREDEDYVTTGKASWYGAKFHGRRTANGETFNMHALTGAHPTLPMPSYVRVTNLSNDRSVIVRINDRGPFTRSRVIDVSRKTAEMLDFKRAGTARVKVEYVGPAKLNPKDHSYLLASYRGPGQAKPPAREKEGIREDAPARGPDMSPARSVLIASRSTPATDRGADDDGPRGSTVTAFLGSFRRGDTPAEPRPAEPRPAAQAAPPTATGTPPRAAPDPGAKPAASTAGEVSEDGGDAVEALILLSETGAPAGESEAGSTASVPEPRAAADVAIGDAVVGASGPSPTQPAADDRFAAAHAAFETDAPGLAASSELDALTLVRAAGRDGS